MALDSFLIKAQAMALDGMLSGSRIDKIFMPSQGEVVLGMRSTSENIRLMISSSGSNSGVYLTSLRPENPPSPPMFCMLLRKHMQGGKIISVEQPGGERIMTITFTSMDELGRMSEKRLVCELMGKRTNILLLDEEGIILGCVKKIDYDMSPDRAVLPGLVYRLPKKSGKPSVFDMTREEIASVLEGALDGDGILSRLDGVSPLIAKELSFRGMNSLEMAGIMRELSDGAGRPYLIRRSGRDFDFSAMPITMYEDCDSLPYDSFSSLLDDFYRARRQADLKKSLSSSLKKNLENHRSRLERKLGKQRQELLEAQNRSGLKKNADLITSNIYAIRSGDKKAVVTDYFSEGMPKVEIPLDPDISPQQNAQLLYKRYARLKNAEEALAGQIGSGEQELSYIESLLYGIELASNEKDIRDLTSEAAAAGYVKAPAAKRQKPEKQPAASPRRYVTSGGFTLLRGRGNRENDYLTMKMAKGGDIWFHARNIPGSHVILVIEGHKPDVSDIEEAAGLAAFYSKASSSPKAAVDYTLVKHVKKPSGAKPGMVNYFEFKTILVEPRDMTEI